MHIEVRFPIEALVDANLPTYEPGADDIRALLDDICEFIGEKGQFIVSGFGQDPWPVDVSTDLPVLLEQLPEALDAIRSGRPFKIDFYEQGLERTVDFSPIGDHYIATCASFGAWQPTREPERIARATLQEMLLAIREGFVLLLNRNFGGLESNPLVESWLGYTTRD